MVLVCIQLRSGAVVPRDNAAEPLFSLDLTFVSRLEIRTKNLVSDIYSLMRSFVIVIRQPFMIDMIKMIQAKTNKVIKALFLNDADTGFSVSVCLGRTRRSLYDFCARCFPQIIECIRELCVAVANEMGRFDPDLIHPYRSILIW